MSDFLERVARQVFDALNERPLDDNVLHGDVRLLAQEILVPSTPEPPAHEVVCPSCGATIRARMADAPPTSRSTP